MTQVVIALGSNLGDREGNLRMAVEKMAEAGLIVERGSSIWQTTPVPADQPAYLNATVVAQTGLAPLELLATLKGIEQELGRTPSWRWGPRTIDLDILFYDELAMDTPELTIPHSQITGRGFVLAPLSQVMDGPLPVLGVTARNLLADAGSDGLQDTGTRLIV